MLSPKPSPIAVIDPGARAARSRRRARIVPAALVLICLLSWLHQAYYDFENDDAYISYRYARNWAAGQGPVFTAGERVEGYSNFLLVAILASVAKLGGDPVTAARLLGTFALWGLVVLAYLVASRRLGRGPGLAIGASLGVALHGGLACWARSGMETLPLAFLLLSAQFVFLGELSGRRAHWRSSLLFAAVSLMRADGFVHFAATVVFLVLQRGYWRQALRRPLRGPQNETEPLKNLWSLILPFVAVVGPYFLWRWQYYGHLFPNPYYLRTGGDIYQQLRGLFYIYNFIVPFGGLLLFAVPLLLLWLRNPARDAQRLYLGTCLLVFTAYVVWVGGDYMPMARFFVPVAAALVVLQLETVAEVVTRIGDVDREADAELGRFGTMQRPVIVVLTACVLLSGFLPTLNPRRQPQNRAIVARVQVEQWTLAGRWLAAHTPPGTLLAAEPVGALGYYSNLPIVDMLGVNDAHIAHLETRHLGHSTAGHEKRDFDYVLSRRPHLIFRGVWPECTGDGDIQQYSAGSSYTKRCIPIGIGPVANDLGEVQQLPLFLHLEDRNAESN